MSRCFALYACKLSKPKRLIPFSATKQFKTRLVMLKPGQCIGEHSTKNYEELIFVIEGKVRVTDFHRAAEVSAPSAVLIPQNTRHNLCNRTGKNAKYAYVIAMR